jgi:sigma-B regulation protein RsbU (phosphoserine phosphatase)
MEIAAATETLHPRILIADDQADVLEALRLLLKNHGYATEAVTSPGAILDAIQNREYDLLLMDLNYARDTTSGREGLDLVAHLQQQPGAPPIVVMTGWATVGLAVEAMQRGVGDFIEKPWTNARLLEILQTQIRYGRERRETKRREEEKGRTQDEIQSQIHRQELELEDARTTQQGLLPKEIPQLPGYEIAGAWKPARTVGGDYYDVLSFSDTSLGVCIADVAGKGLPAAMLMSNLQAGVRGLAADGVSPESLCTRLNALIYRNISSDRFVTFFYAHLDGSARELRYANAGHNHPVLMHADGSHERLSEGGTVLGVFPMLTFTTATKRLLPGDRVVLFTDGVTEVTGKNGEEFGEARLLSLLRENRTLCAMDLQRIIFEAAGNFSQEHWHDDATLVVIAAE